MEPQNIPIQNILAPEHLLTRLTHQWVCDVLLGLVEAQLVANTNSKTPVAQQATVIRLGHAVDLGQNKAL